MAKELKISLPDLSMLKLSGAKSYLVAVGALVWAGYAVWTGQMGGHEAADWVMSAGSVAALRAAIGKAVAFGQAHQAQIAELKAMVQELQPPTQGAAS